MDVLYHPFGSGEVLGKCHGNVVRDIKEFIDNTQESFSALSFEGANYIDEQTRTAFCTSFTVTVSCCSLWVQGQKALVSNWPTSKPSTRWKPSCSASGKGPCRPPTSSHHSHRRNRRSSGHWSTPRSAYCRRRTSPRAMAKCGAASPPIRDRQVYATAAGEDGRGRGVFDLAGTYGNGRRRGVSIGAIPIANRAMTGKAPCLRAGRT